MIRSYVVPALENVALWHERDISHSSVERGIAPDATAHLDFALHRLAGVIENLVVYPEKMKSNMDRLGGLHNSQRLLLALTQAGEQRESAYRLVQRNAMKVWDIFREDGNAGEGSFKTLILSDKDIMKLLTDEQVQSMFDDEYHLKHVETIFNRVFN